MATYTLTDAAVSGLKRDDGAFIPNAPGNRDWDTFKKEAVDAGLLTQVDADANNMSGLLTDGVLIFPVVLPPLDDVKLRAKSEIDTAAERVRLKYVTNGSGQALTYQEKAKQSDAFKAAGYTPTDGTGFPFVQAEAVATGVTAQDAADFIIATRDQWVLKGSDIEEERTRGKKNVTDAADTAAVEAAKDNAISALNLL